MASITTNKIRKSSMVPPVNYSAMKERRENSIAWRLFVNASKNQAMREHLFRGNGSTCRYCGRRVEDSTATVHHLNYDRECAHSEWVPEIGRRKNIPSCDRCLDETPGEFETCANMICAVHEGCHCRIHGLPTKRRKTPISGIGPYLVLLDEPACAVCPRGFLSDVKRALSRRGIPFESYRWHEVKAGAAPIGASAAKKAMSAAFGAGDLGSKNPCVIVSRCPQSAIAELVISSHNARKERGR